MDCELCFITLQIYGILPSSEESYKLSTDGKKALVNNFDKWKINNSKSENFVEIQNCIDIIAKNNKCDFYLTQDSIFEDLQSSQTISVKVIKKCLEKHKLKLKKLISSGINGSTYISCYNNYEEEIVAKVGVYNGDNNEYIMSSIAGDLKFGPKIIKQIKCRGIEVYNSNSIPAVIEILLMEKLDLTLESYLKKIHSDQQIYRLVVDLNELFNGFAGQDYIHNDIKPDNIMIKYIDGSPKPYIIDFTTTQPEYDYNPNKYFGWLRYNPPIFDPKWDRTLLLIYLDLTKSKSKTVMTFIKYFKESGEILPYTIDDNNTLTINSKKISIIL